MSTDRDNFINRLTRKPEIGTLEELICGDCNKPASLVYAGNLDEFIVMHEDAEEDANHKFNPGLGVIDGKDGQSGRS